MSNPLPNTLALGNIADGSEIIASTHRNNYAAIQAAVNLLRQALAGGTSGQVLTAVDGTDVQWSSLTNTFNVMNYGAVGDGVTDDQGAIVNADAAAAAAGGVLYFPGGKTFLVDGLLLTSQYIKGDGATLKLNTSGTNILNGPAFTNGCVVSGLKLNCQGLSGSMGIDLPIGTNNVLIENCQFLNCGFAGIAYNTTAGSVTDLRIRSCVFQNGSGNGVVMNSNTAVTRLSIVGNHFLGSSNGAGVNINVNLGSATGVVVANNLITSYTNATGGFGIDIAGSTTVAAVNVSDVTIEGNVIQSCTLQGVHLEGAAQGISVNCNTIDSCGGEGVVVVGNATFSPRQITINGNSVTACCTSSGAAGINVGGSAAVLQTTVSNNVIRGCGRGGVTMSGIATSASSTVLISGNTCVGAIGTTTNGISVGASAMISGNKVYDDGAATTQFGLSVGGSGAVTVIGNDFSGASSSPITFTSTGFLSSDSVVSGSGSPASVVFAAPGCIYKQTNGAAGTVLWVKNSGNGNTGWGTVANAGGSSTQTPGAVTTVSIAHGLGVAPTRCNINFGDANSRSAPAFYITFTATNIVLNFASTLTASTAYTWIWEAGV